ncbi:transmembrane protein 26 [Fopius arisanus]|uniref:Transmembrane protein 26 n=1 Tax=Fopius arisanus TaxID=64838 RepID=A0A9R1TCJ5_9HYME|nr:PREDICTED: transmembrane protein 26 [Fopius arisanus]
MARFIATIKAIITRLVFASHGFIAIWQVATFKKNPLYWYLSCPILVLFFEGLFTLTIKENQEWKWFCPSVFLYLGSVVPAIWLLELDKLERIMKPSPSQMNISKTLDLSHLAAKDLEQLEQLFGVKMQLPEIQISTETWVTLIEQFLMLVLIVGRWMLPKGDLTRDQLSQLLLVYIGTAADIIEFFDSFKEPSISSEFMLVYLTLGIWSWSLIQFTVVLTATKSRKSRLSTGASVRMKVQTETSCCSIDVWAIALNMILQDAPFLAFRLLIIIHFKIVSYMNIFFTCKNTLVILLQLYRLYVVQTEKKTRNRKRRRRIDREELPSISIVSREDIYGCEECRGGRRRRRELEIPSETEYSSEELNRYELTPKNLDRCKRKSKNDTGYSTSSSRNSSKHEKYRKKEVNRSSSTRRAEFSKNEVTYEDERQSKMDRNSRKCPKSSNPGKSTIKSKSEGKKRKEREKSESIEENRSSNSVEGDKTESDSTGTESESEQRYQRRKRRSRE